MIKSRSTETHDWRASRNEFISPIQSRKDIIDGMTAVQSVSSKGHKENAGICLDFALPLKMLNPSRLMIAK